VELERLQQVKAFEAFTKIFLPFLCEIFAPIIKLTIPLCNKVTYEKNCRSMDCKEMSPLRPSPRTFNPFVVRFLHLFSSQWSKYSHQDSVTFQSWDWEIVKQSDFVDFDWGFPDFYLRYSHCYSQVKPQYKKTAYLEKFRVRDLKEASPLRHSLKVTRPSSII